MIINLSIATKLIPFERSEEIEFERIIESVDLDGLFRFSFEKNF
jgi:hypothetical protein